ncbi:MAG: tyrosine-type recombinase/integrase [Candidatus Sulfotelmatobacter sp.]
MLRIYRRHRKSCEHRADGKYRRCRCPIWIDGFLGDQDIRKSLRVADWQKAETMRGEWEAAGVPATDIGEAISIAAAEKEFLADCESRKLKNSTVGRYRILFRELDAFAAKEGFRFLKQLDVPVLNKFRATWKGESGLTDLKKLERLRSFFKFALANGHIQQNPAAAIRNPKIRPNPTLPFSQEEMLRIFAAAGKKITDAKPPAKNKARRVRALILLLRYAGLRISDAIGCETDRLQNGKLFLYTQKTGQHVYCPLPEFVVTELERAPRVSDRYWFWTGVGTVETARKKWSEALTDLFADAKVIGGHAHRFRDTMAVELLKAGTPIERVSILLGHSSVRVTEKHYNPWNRARQEQAEADVARSWATDPIVLLETKGTPEVHGERKAVN